MTNFVKRPFPLKCFDCKQEVISRHCDSTSCRWMKCDVCKSVSAWVIERMPHGLMTPHGDPLVKAVPKFIKYPWAT